MSQCPVCRRIVAVHSFDSFARRIANAHVMVTKQVFQIKRSLEIFAIFLTSLAPQTSMAFTLEPHEFDLP